jgi:putative transposase
VFGSVERFGVRVDRSLSTTGQQHLYDGRELFEQFRETTEHIAQRQATVKREEGRDTSTRIQRLYCTRTRRDHPQNALVRDPVERLHENGIATVYVGDLTDVLETHWSCEVNEKIHQFWVFRAFIDRLACVCEEYGIRLEVESEAWTSQKSPQWAPQTERRGIEIHCPVHVGSRDTPTSQPQRRSFRTTVRPMARPVRLKRDNHEWRPDQRSPPTGTMTNEERTTLSHDDGKLATVESASPNPQR